MNKSAIEAYFAKHGIDISEGLLIIEALARLATKTDGKISAFEDSSGDIVFQTITKGGGYRNIELKPAVVKNISGRLEKTVQRLQISKEIDRAKAETVVSGTIDCHTRNGWFVKLANIYGFMPKREAVEKEAAENRYKIGSRLPFFVKRGLLKGEPRIILSRKSFYLALAAAENIFSVYGFVKLRRFAGASQNVLLRAFPKKADRDIYQKFFPSDRIFFHKLCPSGEIAKMGKKPLSGGY